MSRVIEHPEGLVFLEPAEAGFLNIRVELSDPTAFMLRDTIRTRYDQELIERVLGVKGPATLCDEIARDEDPGYVAGRLIRSLLAYVDPARFEGARILDFGCGSGASTMILARNFPRAEIVGVELNPKLLDLARARAAFYGFPGLTLRASPGGTALPEGLGSFDFIVMNAVYEHLLPDERRAVMPKLWGLLKPGGILFLDETPNRIYHVEGHTTSIPLLNYLPDALAHAVVRRFSYRFNDASWLQLLREGVRGGTESEVVRMLGLESKEKPRVIEPARLGMRDRIDLYFASGDERPDRIPRRIRKAALRAFRGLTGITYTRALAIAVQKPSNDSGE